MLYNPKVSHFVRRWVVDDDDNILEYIITIDGVTPISLKPSQVRAFKTNNMQIKLINNPNQVPEYYKKLKFRPVDKINMRGINGRKKT